MDGIEEILEQYGGDPASFLHFGVDRPELLPYATLTTSRSTEDRDLAALLGVYEWQERPLLFIVDGAAYLNSKVRLDRVRRLVAMRGDVPYLGVVTPGNLTIYNVSLRGNRGGAWRIDVANAEIVALEEVLQRPALLKTLFRGTRLDLELHQKIADKGHPTLDTYWRELFGVYRGRPRYSGNGYQRLRPSSRTRKDATQPGVSARYLHHLQELSAGNMPSLVVRPSTETQPFRLARIHDRRAADLFVGPLFLVRESPPVEHGRIRTSVCLTNVVFNQSYHGYSTQKHPQARQFAQYLALIVGSKISLWHALITSGRFGFEREVVEKFVIDELPIPRFESLSPANKDRASDLFASLSRSDSEDEWERVDKWVATLFGLDALDLTTITDTLQFRLPFSANQRAAQKPITEQLPSLVSETLSNQARSVHGRSFEYVHVPAPRLPGGIALWHLWLNCEAARQPSGTTRPN